MSRDDLQCSITNRPFLVYGSLTAYFFPLAVMLVAYTASIRLLGRQGVETRLRWGAAADPGSWLRRSRSARQTASAVQSGARTPELYACRYRRDECVSGSAAASVGGSFRGRDALHEHVVRQRSYLDSSLSPLPCVDDGPSASTTDWTPSSTTLRTEPTRRRNVAGADRPLTDSDGAEQTRRDEDKSSTLMSQPSFVGGVLPHDATAPDRRLSGDDGCTHNSLDLASRDPTRDSPAPATSATVAHTSGQRFRSLVQKHAATILAAGEFLQSRDRDDGGRPHRNQVATAVAAVAAIRTVRTERKAARVIGAVFAVFVACWTPFFVLNLSLGVCGPPCDQAVTGDGSLLYPVFLWLGYVASTLNPIVYTAFNGTFRRTFVDLLTCRRSRSQHQPYTASRASRRRRQNSTV